MSLLMHLNIIESKYELFNFKITLCMSLKLMISVLDLNVNIICFCVYANVSTFYDTLCRSAFEYS